MDPATAAALKATKDRLEADAKQPLGTLFARMVKAGIITPDGRINPAGFLGAGPVVLEGDGEE